MADSEKLADKLAEKAPLGGAPFRVISRWRQPRPAEVCEGGHYNDPR